MEKLIVKLPKGGKTIGFSLYNNSNCNTSSNFHVFENKNTNNKL